MISGQDPSCLIGEVPRSVAKRILVIAFILLGLGALVIGLIRW